MTNHPAPKVTPPNAQPVETGAPDVTSPVDLDRERLARVALTQLIEPARSAWSAVIGEHESATDLYRAVLNGTLDETIRERMSEVAADAFARARLAEQLADLDPEVILTHAANRGYRFVIPGDQEWPSQLDRLTGQRPIHRVSGAPLGLWVRGNLDLGALHDAVAVTGSRAATPLGCEVSARLAGDLANAGHVVVAGGAVGIDVAAHRGALAGGGRTVAVLPTGVDRLWPAINESLLEAVAENGAVVSEYAPGSVVTRTRGLARARLVAALSLGTVVVEASARSGALVTALWAERLNKPVMAVPGPVGSTTSIGTNRLIQDGRASLITDADDIRQVIEP
ncbi:DNA-processing protein DprA [Nocardioides sp. NBC_00368]|uniref:DNA-processing protein DprA n=1 Tax=Nocardioides sp. NBC_00368 TaxID=2976000 RepID=UPI002E1F7EC6